MRARFGDNVLRLKLDSVMALDDQSSCLALKAMSYGEPSSTIIAVSGRLSGVQQYRRCNASLNSVSERQASHHMSLETVHALAGNCRRLSLFQKVLEETRPALPSLVDQSMLQCFGVVRCR